MIHPKNDLDQTQGVPICLLGRYHVASHDIKARELEFHLPTLFGDRESASCGKAKPTQPRKKHLLMLLFLGQY